MTLQSTVRGAFDVIAGLLPETAVTVVSDGQSASGIGDKTEYGESLEMNGERGITRRRVRVSANDITIPAKGSTILIDGAAAIVGNTSTDSAGAILVIEYQLTTPLE